MSTEGYWVLRDRNLSGLGLGYWNPSDVLLDYN